MNWGFWLVILSGWINREQAAAIDYLQEENRVLREQLAGKRLQLTDVQRQRLAIRAYALGKKRLRFIPRWLSPD